MAQLNLLPDVKLEFIRAQRKKRTVIAIGAIASIASLAIMIFLFTFVHVAQRQHLKALDADINTSIETLKQNPDLDKILTVQNQLNSLPSLHNDKMITSRTFEYLTKVTPKQATISDASLDFDANVLNIKGNADSLRTINKFADTLKFTEFKVEGESPLEGMAFSNVVLKTFSVEDAADDEGISYELEMNFDIAIYTNSEPNNEGKSPVTFVVPNIVSTRSATQAPDNLFAPQPATQEEDL
jgi:Tfp pilus assembly protein PilN